MTARTVVKALVRLGMLPPGYDKPLIYERTRGLRVYFLHRKGRAAEPARFDGAATLCRLFIGAMESEFQQHPEKIPGRWQSPM